MNPYLAPGVTESDLEPCEVCARCQRQIGPGEPHVLLTDVPLIDALVCMDCAQDCEPDYLEPEPSNLQMCLVMGYWGMSTAWDWAKAKLKPN